MRDNGCGGETLKKITFIMVVITLILSFGMTIFQNPLLANTEKNKEELRDKYLNIMTVNKPQAEMVKKIVKDKHNVQYMMTEESDIRDFKYTNDIVNNVSDMDLFLYSGTDFEPWINKFIGKLKKGSIGIINLARGIRMLNYDPGNGTKENPYYFEGIEEYKIALLNVKNSIQDKDPKNRDFYEKNYNEEVKRFDEQINKLKENLAYLKDYTFLTFDAGFDYILDDLNINYLNLNDEYIDKFIVKNNLDPEKVILIQDGEDKKNIDAWISDDYDEEDTQDKFTDYKTVDLWKYYGKMPFDDLIVYNVNEISKIALNEKENSQLNTSEIIEENNQN